MTRTTTLTFPDFPTDPPKGRPGPSVSSRLLAVLDCFDLGRQVLGLTEIAESSGLPLSTARRLIMELVTWGALERLADGRYRVGTRLWRVGTLAAVQRELREAAAPMLQQLSADSGGSAQLVVRDGLEALCIDVVRGPSAVRTATSVGGQLPLHATAVGKVLLAAESSTTLAALVDRGLPRYTPRTIVEPGRLAAVVAGVRANGLGRCHEEMTVGIVSIAAGIRSREGTSVGAIGLVVRAGQTVDRYVSPLRAAARKVSHRLR